MKIFLFLGLIVILLSPMQVRADDGLEVIHVSKMVGQITRKDPSDKCGQEVSPQSITAILVYKQVTGSSGKTFNEVSLSLAIKDSYNDWLLSLSGDDLPHLLSIESKEEKNVLYAASDFAKFQGSISATKINGFFTTREIGGGDSCQMSLDLNAK